MARINKDVANLTIALDVDNRKVTSKVQQTKNAMNGLAGASNPLQQRMSQLSTRFNSVGNVLSSLGFPTAARGLNLLSSGINVLDRNMATIASGGKVMMSTITAVASSFTNLGRSVLGSGLTGLSRLFSSATSGAHNLVLAMGKLFGFGGLGGGLGGGMAMGIGAGLGSKMEGILSGTFMGTLLAGTMAKFRVPKVIPSIFSGAAPTDMRAWKVPKFNPLSTSALDYGQQIRGSMGLTNQTGQVQKLTAAMTKLQLAGIALSAVFVPATAALGAFLLLISGTKIIDKFTASLGELADQARKLEVSPESLKSWQLLAKYAGMDQSKIESILTGYNRTLTQLAKGNTMKQNIFGLLGIDMSQLKGMDKLKQVETLLYKIREFEPNQRFVFLSEVFGPANAKELLLVIDDIEITLERIAKLRPDLFSKEDLLAVEQFGDSVIDIGVKWERLIDKLRKGPGTTIGGFFIDYSENMYENWSAKFQSLEDNYKLITGMFNGTNGLGDLKDPLLNYMKSVPKNIFDGLTDSFFLSWKGAMGWIYSWTEKNPIEVPIDLVIDKSPFPGLNDAMQEEYKKKFGFEISPDLLIEDMEFVAKTFDELESNMDKFKDKETSLNRLFSIGMISMVDYEKILAKIKDDYRLSEPLLQTQAKFMDDYTDSITRAWGELSKLKELQGVDPITGESRELPTNVLEKARKNIFDNMVSGMDTNTGLDFMKNLEYIDGLFKDGITGITEYKSQLDILNKSFSPERNNIEGFEAKLQGIRREFDLGIMSASQYGREVGGILGGFQVSNTDEMFDALNMLSSQRDIMPLEQFGTEFDSIFNQLENNAFNSFGKMNAAMDLLFMGQINRNEAFILLNDLFYALEAQAIELESSLMMGNITPEMFDAKFAPLIGALEYAQQLAGDVFGMNFQGSPNFFKLQNDKLAQWESMMGEMGGMFQQNPFDNWGPPPMGMYTTFNQGDIEPPSGLNSAGIATASQIAGVLASSKLGQSFEERTAENTKLTNEKLDRVIHEIHHSGI